MLLDYIPSVVAFCAVLVGILGKPKLDHGKRGLRRLTPSGWATLMVGVCALLASWVLTSRAHTKADRDSEQRAQVRRIAHYEVRLALRQCVWPFFSVLDGKLPHQDFDALVPQNAFDPHSLAEAAALDTGAPSPRLPSGSTFDRPLVQIFKQNATIGLQRLDRAMQTYAAYLEPEVLQVCWQLRNSEYLTMRIADEEVGLGYPFVGADMLTSGMDLRPTGSEAYAAFWEAMRVAERLLPPDWVRFPKRI